MALEKNPLLCKHGISLISCGSCSTRENMLHFLRKGEQRQGEMNSVRLLDQVLQDSSLSVMCKDELFGMPALCLVSSIGHEESVKKLLHAGADVNCVVPTDKNSPLILATQGRHIELIKLLITAGANLAHCNNEGNNAFMVAVSTGDAHPVNLLWQYRSNFNINQENVKGYTAIHLAAERQWESCVNMLICGGADKQWQTYDGSTALIIATKKGDKKTVERLLAASASVDIEDNESATALCYAIRDKKCDLVDLLMKKLFFSKDDKESYVRRRIDLLRTKTVSNGTISKEDFFDSILIPVIQELCKHQECRDILFRIRAMFQLIPFLDTYLTNEEVAQKTFITLCMLMYVYSSTPDSRFVDQFVSAKGHELVLKSLYFYDASNSYDPKIIFTAFMPIISIYATLEGREWLKKNYYKLSQYSTIFEAGCDISSFLDCCRGKFMGTWQRFKWHFTKTSQEQAELVCAELLENEEREKARERAKKEKRREKRKNRKIQQRAEREYAEKLVDGDDSLFDDVNNSPESQNCSYTPKGSVIADFLSGVQQKVKGLLGKIPASPPRDQRENVDDIQKVQEQHAKKKRRKKNKPKRSEEDEVLLNHCAINPVFDRIQYSPKVIKSRTTKVPNLPRVEDIIEPCENVSGDAPEVLGAMATPERVGINCSKLSLPCLVAGPEHKVTKDLLECNLTNSGLVPLDTSSPVKSYEQYGSVNMNENARGYRSQAPPRVNISLDDVTEDSMAGLSPIGTPREVDTNGSLTSSSITPEKYGMSPRPKHGKHIVRFKEMKCDGPPSSYAFCAVGESRVGSMSPRGRTATWAEITKKDAVKTRPWSATNIRYGSHASKLSQPVFFQPNDNFPRSKKSKRPPRLRPSQDTKLDIISPTKDSRIVKSTNAVEGKPAIQKVNLRDMKIPLSSFIPDLSRLNNETGAGAFEDRATETDNERRKDRENKSYEQQREKSVEVSCYRMKRDAQNTTIEHVVDVDAMAEDPEYVRMQMEALDNFSKDYKNLNFVQDVSGWLSETSDGDVSSENGVEKKEGSVSSDADMEVQRILQEDVIVHESKPINSPVTKSYHNKCTAPPVCFYDFGIKTSHEFYESVTGDRKLFRDTNLLTDIRVENIPAAPDVEFARLTPDPDDGFSNLDNTEYIYYPGMDHKMLQIRGLFQNTANNRFHKLIQMQFEAANERKVIGEMSSMGRFYQSRFSPKQFVPPPAGSLWSNCGNRQGAVGVPASNAVDCRDNDSSITWVPKSQRWRSIFKELTALSIETHTKVGPILFHAHNQRFGLTSSNHSSASSYLGILEDGTEISVRRMSLDDYAHLKKNLPTMLYPAVRHESLAKFLHATEDDHYGYLAIELCEYNLEEYIQHMRSRNEYDFRIAKRLVWQFLKALQYLHETCLVAQRNLKPQNILLDTLNKVRLTDYNISRMTESGQTILYDKGVGCNCWRPKECVTSGQAWTGTASVVNYTTKSDIQVAGMLVHYILTGGVHPYGDNTFDIELNIARGWPRWRRINEEANDLIRWMLSNEEKERPNITQTLRHPFFWPELKRMDFLHTVGKEILSEFQYGPATNSVISERLNNVSFQAVSRDWMSQIDELLLEEMRTHRNYKNNVADFLRFIVNCQTQYKNLSPTSKSILGEDRLYFLRSFPALFMSVYRVVKGSEWAMKMSFSKFF